ncbi:MAG: IclR family transcriptional regulator [Aquisalimonadaceae bacterium]
MSARRTTVRTASGVASASSQSGPLRKALDVLKMVMQPVHSPSAAQISATLGIPRPTTNRIIGNLIRLGFLKRDAARSQLIEGDELLSLALAVVARAAQRGPRHDILLDLAATTKETCNVGIIANGRVRYIDRVEAEWPLSLRLEPGSEVPLHCSALGKLLLSQLPQVQLEKYLQTMKLRRFTEHTITDAGQLRRELEAIAIEGVSLDNEEYFSGVVGMAVPIPLGDDHPMLGLAVAAPSARLTVSELRKDLPLLHEAAAKLAVCYRVG